MSENCPACEKRNRMHHIQMEGRQAASLGNPRASNPCTDDVEKQYWEYGWIEENFMNELEEHRAVMQYAGEHLFIFCDELQEYVEQGKITQKVKDEIVNNLHTIMKNLAEKLQGN